MKNEKGNELKSFLVGFVLRICTNQRMPRISLKYELDTCSMPRHESYLRENVRNVTIDF